MRNALAVGAVLGTLLTSPLAAQAPPLLAHWRFDETAGLAANDSGPLGNHGQLVNQAAPVWVAGRFGNALQFDGVDDYIAIAAGQGLPVYRGTGTPFSIAFWVKAPAQADRRVWSEQQAAPAGGGPLFTLGSGSGSTAANAKLRVFVRSDLPANVVNVLSLADVFDDTWHHVVYTDHAGHAALWIDGALDSVLDYSRWSWGPLSPLPSTFAIDTPTIGAVVRNGAVATPLQGLVDDLRVYGSVLDQADVQVVLAGADPGVVVGSLAAIGRGCGTGPLDLVATGSASLGGTIWTQLVRGEPGALALVALGLGPLQPVDLAPFGHAGCTLWQQNVATALVGVVGPSGSAAPFAFPVTGALGTLLSIQGVTLGSGVALSPAANAMLGR
jgi:hypothetical protein